LEFCISALLKRCSEARKLTFGVFQCLIGMITRINK